MLLLIGLGCRTLNARTQHTTIETSYVCTQGCCSSSPNGTEIQNLKENADELQALKGKEEQLRPASSTVMKNGELIPSRSVTPRSETPDELGLRKGKSKRGKPSGLRVGGSKQLRDPNMIVTTPMNGDHDAFPSRPDDTILPTDKREAVAMFVSWEKPALGKKKRGGKKGGKKRSKTVTNYHIHVVYNLLPSPVLLTHILLTPFADGTQVRDAGQKATGVHPWLRK